MLSNSIEIVGVTDTGSVRQFNEDNILYDPHDGVMVLADGMGGHRAGEVASRMAAEIIMERLRSSVAEFGSSGDQHLPQLAVKRSINHANGAVFEAARANPACYGMGTTLVLAVFYDNRVTLGHVGDSRIYRLRNGRLELLTRDDSLLRDEIELGMIAAADARGSHNRSLVTRALGIERQVAAHVREDDALPGDVFLLCSDGLNDLLEDADIELIVHQCFLDQERVSIGREASNHVVIDDPAVSREHAAIFQAGNDHVLSDLHTEHGTFVNGTRVDRHILQHGDVVEFGVFNLRYLKPRASAESDMDRTMLIPGLRESVDSSEDASPSTDLRIPAAQWVRTRLPKGRVKVHGGARNGTVIELDRVVATFGEAGTQLAVVTRRPHGYFITHVHGRRLPRVNQRTIGSDPHLLRNGDVIDVADERLEFLLD